MSMWKPKRAAAAHRACWLIGMGQDMLMSFCGLIMFTAVHAMEQQC